jgi:hypothetical protein
MTDDDAMHLQSSLLKARVTESCAATLIEQVEGADYRDVRGKPLEENIAYLALKEAVGT